MLAPDTWRILLFAGLSLTWIRRRRNYRLGSLSEVFRHVSFSIKHYTHFCPQTRSFPYFLRDSVISLNIEAPGVGIMVQWVKHLLGVPAF